MGSVNYACPAGKAKAQKRFKKSLILFPTRQRHNGLMKLDDEEADSHFSVYSPAPRDDNAISRAKELHRKKPPPRYTMNTA